MVNEEGSLNLTNNNISEMSTHLQASHLKGFTELNMSND
jgi:hypothetical protein